MNGNKNLRCISKKVISVSFFTVIGGIIQNTLVHDYCYTFCSSNFGIKFWCKFPNDYLSEVVASPRELDPRHRRDGLMSRAQDNGGCKYNG